MDCESGVSCLFCLVAQRMKRSEECPSSEPPPLKCMKAHAKQVCRLRNPAYFRDRRQKILSEIKFDYSRMLVLWDFSYRTNDYAISKAICKYGKARVVKQGSVTSRRGEYKWYDIDAVVEFPRRIDAQNALKEIQENKWSIKSALMEEVIHSLAESEVFRPEIEGATTRIKVFKRYRLKDLEVRILHRMLHSFGRLTTFLVNNRADRNEVVCEATFAHAAHAYLAAVMTHGTFLSHMGRVFPGDVITVCVHYTERVVEIVEEARKSLLRRYEYSFPC